MDDEDKERTRHNEAEEGSAMSQPLLPLKQSSKPNGASAPRDQKTLEQLGGTSWRRLKYTMMSRRA